MAPDSPFETARMRLRRVTPADRDDLIALEADPQVMRFLNGGKPVPDAGLPDGGFLTPHGTERQVLVAHDRGTGGFIGWFAFFDDGEIGGLRTAEIGYRLAVSSWGQGFATEGVTALVGMALGPWGFDRVRAETMAVNTGSRRVMEKAGMRHVGTIHPVFPDPIEGAEQGEVIYEIRRY